MTKEYTHYRKGHQVFTTDGQLVFDGMSENPQGDWNRNWQKIIHSRNCGPEFKGINAAKKYVRTNNLSSVNK